MAIDRNQGDGPYIDFGSIPTRNVPPPSPLPNKTTRENTKFVKISWVLVAALIGSLLIITYLSFSLNRANHVIQEQNRTIEEQKRTVDELTEEIRTLKSRR